MQDTPHQAPPSEETITETLEQLESLLIFMLSAPLGDIAPASVRSGLALAHNLTCNVLSAAKSQIPS